MIRLAIIGTNWITDQFVEAALKTGEYQLSAVYSRSLESAERFAEKYASPALFDDLDLLAASPLFDAVYIASPNILHGPQAMQMMKAGKHVIVEKPMASNLALAKQMFKLAEESNVLLFEAFMSAHIPNFKRLKDELSSIGQIRKGFITYCQYSSRYPKYLAGENPNTFNPEFANGSIMDIGFYCLSSAVELFGEPKSVKAAAQLLDSGVDGSGSVVLEYDGFEVVLQHSKTSDSYLPSEIQGEEGVLLMEMISTAKKLTKFTRGSDVGIDLSVKQELNPMYYEALEVASQFKQQSMNSSCTQRSLIVAKLLEEIRRQTGVVFPTDKKNFAKKK
ncbi:Gfo/Idh/MocA family oxidoreductase [Vibrio europaeus]|uniref:Gfo/Idh/MocA family protein n=1 Tax=Vibrio europaeus TaxID=300876 RepID=UPI00233F3460|nr:Gfo/Idh/MocA family oxidoreductase [Vibrio europaeus]MDC5818434.1 Gfo/Idh/MocA family oxidoreductase [Vibrio europaeus]MDC5871563.1 Gfo/Idh/MocA family oxidoreductase [Vibrio europaeus]